MTRVLHEPGTPKTESKQITSPTSSILQEAAPLLMCFNLFFFFFAQNLDKQQPLAEGLFKYVMMLPPAYEKAVNSEDFDR